MCWWWGPGLPEALPPTICATRAPCYRAAVAPLKTEVTYLKNLNPTLLRAAARSVGGEVKLCRWLGLEY